MSRSLAGRFGCCLLLAAAVMCVAGGPGAAFARQPIDRRNEIGIASLPREAREVLALIRSGGPFRFERDGVTFGNREGSLPSARRGFYHEYTVATPGVRTRGARRLVCGGPRTMPDACYYSDDHYATFRRIRE